MSFSGKKCEKKGDECYEGQFNNIFIKMCNIMISLHFSQVPATSANVTTLPPALSAPALLDTEGESAKTRSRKDYKFETRKNMQKNT
jgi:hypothetical protein